ncbi:MAG: tetratricopeptide repeat protein [Vampirovibrio sp.]|nr:tetratricopeptide repeat protein [Vampirovibrio sp.]
MPRYSRHRYRRNFFLGKFYLSPTAQFMTTIIGAVLFAGLVFSGYLLYRHADSAYFINEGKAYLEEGKVALAAKTFEEMVRQHQDNYEAYIYLGQAYLELGERKKAELQFKMASSLKAEGMGDQVASLAMSKLDIARKHFLDAEKRLVAQLETEKKRGTLESAQTRELEETLVELYETWGNSLMKDTPDYSEAIDKYEQAIVYSRRLHVENRLKDKLVEAIMEYADQLMGDQKMEDAVSLLKKSLRYRYLPDTLIAIADKFEQSGDVDSAIEWYRKAFDANPDIISIKLSNMLVRKGRDLLANKKPEEAEAFFNEAEEISRLAKISVDVIYPVAVTEVELIPEKMDHDTGEFTPVAKFKLKSKSYRPLNFLAARARFYSGDKLIAEASEVAAKPESPLLNPKEPNGKDGKKPTKEKSGRLVTLKASKRLNNHMLKSGMLQVKVSIAYTEDANPEWFVKAIHEIKIQRRSIQVKDTLEDEPSDNTKQVEEPKLETPAAAPTPPPVPESSHPV